MGQFIDFEALKKSVGIQDVANWLGLELKQKGNQLRGICPLHGGGERALTITLDYPNNDGSVGRYFCFAPECREGGDAIALVAKVKQISTRDAAIELQKAFQSPRTAPQTRKLPEAGLDYLQPKHDQVQALGFDIETAKALGIGWAPKGLMRGRVAIPLRNPDGTVAGYMGVNPELDPIVKLPNQLFT